MAITALLAGPLAQPWARLDCGAPMYRSQQQGSGEATWRLGGLNQNAVGLLALLLAMLAAAALILWLERDTIFMSDEWSWLGAAGDASLNDLLRPINQHLMVGPLLVTDLFLSLWGTSMTPFAIAEAIGVIACGGAVYAFARPRLGPIVALAPAMVPMFLGTGAVILLQPLIGVQALYSLAFGVGALAAVDRGDRRGDVAATILACLSLAFFSIGIAFLAGLAVAILLTPERFRRAYVFLVPLVLYGAWRIWAQKYGTSGGPELANVPAVPFYWVDSLALTASALFGRSGTLAPGPGTYLFLQEVALPQLAATLAIAAVEVAVIYVLARRLARSGPIPAMLWATAAVLFALWTSQGLVLVDGRAPGEPRYIYPGAVALALLASEAARRARLGRRGVAIVLGLTLLGILGNLPRFQDGREAIAYHAPRNLAYVGLMDLAGENADPGFNPAVHTPEASPAGALTMPVQGYLELSERYGPLGYSPAEIAELDEKVRQGADEVLVRMLRLRLEPSARRGRDCRSAEPLPGGGVGAALPRGGAVLVADEPTTVSLRRFADGQAVALGALAGQRPTLLGIPADSARLPWAIEADDPLTICAIR